jgi:hypothetical protein
MADPPDGADRHQVELELSDSQPTGSLSARRKQVLLAVVVLLALTLMMLAAEGAVRLRQSLKYGSGAMQEDHWVDDPKSGLRLPVAGFSSGRISINSLGFRGPEIAVPKPPRTVRIAFPARRRPGAATFPATNTPGRIWLPNR